MRPPAAYRKPERGPWGAEDDLGPFLKGKIGPPFPSQAPRPREGGAGTLPGGLGFRGSVAVLPLPVPGVARYDRPGPAGLPPCRPRVSTCQHAVSTSGPRWAVPISWPDGFLRVWLLGLRASMGAKAVDTWC